MKSIKGQEEVVQNVCKIYENNLEIVHKLSKG